MGGGVGLVSWGRKGTMRFAQMTAELLDERHVEFGLSICSRGELREEITQAFPFSVIVSVPRNRIRMLASPVLARNAATLTIRDFVARGIQRVVILVPHPWDFALRRAARQQGIEVVQLLHDARPHPGDLWPRPSGIRARAQSADEVICLSNHVGSALRDYARKTRIAAHPAIRPKTTLSHPQKPGRGYVLFIGRIKPYKGLNLLFDAWPHVQADGLRLRVVGEGSLPNRPLPDDVDVVNRWLSDSEMADQISRSSLVVLPYIEASQSGVVPLAASLGRPVVATDVGGLSEQVNDGVSGLLCRRLDAQELANTITTALNRDWSRLPETWDNERYVNAIRGI